MMFALRMSFWREKRKSIAVKCALFWGWRKLKWFCLNGECATVIIDCLSFTTILSLINLPVFLDPFVQTDVFVLLRTAWKSFLSLWTQERAAYQWSRSWTITLSFRSYCNIISVRTSAPYFSVWTFLWVRRCSESTRLSASHRRLSSLCKCHAVDLPVVRHEEVIAISILRHHQKLRNILCQHLGSRPTDKQIFGTVRPIRGLSCHGLLNNNPFSSRIAHNDLIS